jgi:hypothetical protein
VAEVTRAGLEAAIVESQGVDGDTLYKVLSPLMFERAEADAELESFQEAGFEAILVRFAE